MVVRALRRASASRKRIRGLFFFLGSRLTSSSTFSTFSSVSSSVYESSTAPQTTLRRPLADNLPVPLEREPPAADGLANRERLGSRRRRSEEFPGQRHRPVGPWALLNDLPASNIAGETDAMLDAPSWFVLTHPPTQAWGFAIRKSGIRNSGIRKVFESTRLQWGGKTSESARAPNAPARQEPDLSKPVPLATGPAEDDNGGRNCGSRRRDQR